MNVFDLEIPEKELESSLSRIYRQSVTIHRYEVEYKTKTPFKRVAAISLILSTVSGLKELQCIIKEVATHELIATSLANILMKYSSPVVFWYKEASIGYWMLTENINKWIDIVHPSRINETLVDGLYEIHSTMLGSTDALAANFNSFPISDSSFLSSRARRSLTDLHKLSRDRVVIELFDDWSTTVDHIEKNLSLDIDFPMTWVHGNYHPSSVRGIVDSSSNVRVAVYDWMYSCISYPQMDLASLLDRIDIMSNGQGLQSPTPILLDRYESMLIDEFENIDLEAFRDTYKFCYTCKMLPLLRWWTKCFIEHPTKEPERCILEMDTKLKRLREEEINDQSTSTEGSEEVDGEDTSKDESLS